MSAVRLCLWPPSPIRLWGGGTSRAALRRAATTLDGWVSEIQTLAELREIAPTLAKLRESSPRAQLPFGICAAVKDAFAAEHFLELEALGVDYVVTVPWMFYGTDYEGSLEEKCEGIRRFGRETIAALAELA